MSSAALATTTSPRGVALMRTLQAALAAMSEHAKSYPHEVAELAAVLANHVRSAWPMAMLADSVPVAAVAPEVTTAIASIEPSWLVERELHDGAKYTLRFRGVDAESSVPVILFRLVDSFGDNASVALTFEQFDTLRADQERVHAAAKGAR